MPYQVEYSSSAAPSARHGKLPQTAFSDVYGDYIPAPGPMLREKAAPTRRIPRRSGHLRVRRLRRGWPDPSLTEPATARRAAIPTRLQGAGGQSRNFRVHFSTRRSTIACLVAAASSKNSALVRARVAPAGNQSGEHRPPAAPTAQPMSPRNADAVAESASPSVAPSRSAPSATAGKGRRRCHPNPGSGPLVRLCWR